MPQRTGHRTRKQRQKRGQLQIQLTGQRRAGMDDLDTWQERGLLPGAVPLGGDLGYDDEADGDQLSDVGEDSDQEGPGAAEVGRAEEEEDRADRRATRRWLTLEDLLGSRPQVVWLRLDVGGGDVAVRSCAAPTNPEAAQALELLRVFVARCFRDGRAHFTPAEWAELLGQSPAPLTRRLTLLLRLAVKANAKVGLGADGGVGRPAPSAEGAGAAFTPHDLGLERFAHKFAALPDGTPFSLRLLLLDQRGRERGGHFFDHLPDAVKLLALRRALHRERTRGEAVSDNNFRELLQEALEELLGTPVPRPTEDQVRRRLRDNFKRKGLGDVFPNQSARQQQYDRARRGSPDPAAPEEPA
jgi:hypothetical protein